MHVRVMSYVEKGKNPSLLHKCAHEKIILHVVSTSGEQNQVGEMSVNLQWSGANSYKEYVIQPHNYLIN